MAVSSTRIAPRLSRAPARRATRVRSSQDGAAGASQQGDVLQGACASPIPLSMKAYFEMINAQGGVNERRSYDAGYSPPSTVEMTRKLVEEDDVFVLSGPVGTPTNTSVWRYLNEKKVPQLFPATGATKWDDPKGHPWTMEFSSAARARDVSTRPVWKTRRESFPTTRPRLRIGSDRHREETEQSIAQGQERGSGHSRQPDGSPNQRLGSRCIN
jgi:hypothetical protein